MKYLFQVFLGLRRDQSEKHGTWTYICSLRRFSGFLLVFRVYLELQHATKVCTVLVVFTCFLSEFWLVLFTSSFFWVAASPNIASPLHAASFLPVLGCRLLRPSKAQSYCHHWYWPCWLATGGTPPQIPDTTTGIVWFIRILIMAYYNPYHRIV